MDIATAALTPVSEGASPPASREAQFTPDGRGVYLITNRDSEFEQLRRVDLVTRRGRSAHRPHSLGHRQLRAQRRRPLPRLGGQRRRRRAASRWSNVASAREILPPLPDGRIGRIAFDPRRQAARRCRWRARSRRATCSCSSSSATRVVRYTKSEAGPDRSAAVRARRAGALSDLRSRQRQATGRFPRSSTARRDAPGPHPVLIDIHGGPESQAVPGFNPFTQFLVRELGFAVITPNVRGSSGYGKTYLNLDNGEDREDSVKDIGALLVWIGAQKRPGCEEACSSPAARTAATCRWRRWCTSATGCAAASTWSASRTS